MGCIKKKCDWCKKRKHDDEGVECISKAIDHLEYELKKIKKNKGRGCCNLK